MIERSSQLKSTTGELLAEKVVRAFQLPLLWLGNFKTSGCLVRRPVLLQQLGWPLN